MLYTRDIGFCHVCPLHGSERTMAACLSDTL
jgi:hypothetical protein